MFFDLYKKFMNEYGMNKKLIKFLAGGMAGITALTITYPTDLLRKHYIFVRENN